MKAIPERIINFLQRQGFVIVSTLDSNGSIHCSAKGIVGLEAAGKVYLIDLYRGGTFSNLKSCSTISLTSIDEHEFSGYTLKGRAEIVDKDKIKGQIIKEWERKVIDRISRRVIKNIRQAKGSSKHPESRFPQPKYLIEMTVEEIVDLTPTHLEFPAE